MSSVSINELPTEILQKTLRYLPPLDLIRGRRVCSRWRDVVDSVVNEEFWHQLCRQDFPSIYKDARLKCDPSLSWHELYKSFHLWGKLDLAEENWILICNYSDVEDRVMMVSAIEGKLCVHKTYKKVYYDLKGEIIKKLNTSGVEKSFKETESAIIYVFRESISNMAIVKKINGEPDFGSTVVISNVSEFAIVGEDVYYLYDEYDEFDDRGKFCSQIFVSKAKDNYESTLVGDLKYSISAMGCKNNTLYVILYTYDVFALEKDKFVFQDNVRSKSSRYILNTYNILHGYELLRGLSYEVGFTVNAYYFYKDSTFIGGGDGILRLYNTEFFLDNPRIEPICQFNIAVRLNPKYSQITGVDIIEKENGHIIFVAVFNGVFAIELTHSS